MPKPLQVVAEVNEEDIPRVAVGQTVLLRTDAFLDRRLEGKVSEITPMGDAVTKTYRIRIGLPDDTPLHVGMSVEANVVTREKADALLIPSDAVQGSTVLVVDGNRVQPPPDRRSAFAALAPWRCSPGSRRPTGSPRRRRKASPTAHACASIEAKPVSR